MKAAGESTAALLSLSFKAQIVADRAAGTNAIADEMILASTDIVDYPEYQDNHEYKTKGEIIRCDGLIMRSSRRILQTPSRIPCKQPSHITALSSWNTRGRLTIRSRIRKPRGIVVNVVEGLYYSYKGAVYLAKADMPNCVYPPDTAGLWQWEKV